VTGGDNPMATSTRLAAMKRPDILVCLDSKNRDLLCDAFNIKKSIKLSDYWESIIARIQDSVWWNSQMPVDDLGKRIWNGRAAMLDALFYVP
jgi:hypothetical protein